MVNHFISSYSSIGVVGRAGSGKTTLALSLGIPVISVDSFFIKDSNFRKELLEYKVERSFDSYADACNMYNWWDWGKVSGALAQIKPSPFVLEGALLGPDEVLESLDLIIFLFVDPETRLRRLLKRDGFKRSFKECIDRFQITEFSESLYYKNVLSRYQDKILFVDQDSNILNNICIDDVFSTVESIPVRILV